VADNKVYQAEVIEVDRGRKGLFAVSVCEELGSVTFSLLPDVWKESEMPVPGICVMLTRVRKWKKGWRALEARFMQPSDEQSQ